MQALLRASMTASCPDSRRVAAFVAGKSPQDALDEIDLHLDRCAACARITACLVSDRLRTASGWL